HVSAHRDQLDRSVAANVLGNLRDCAVDVRLHDVPHLERRGTEGFERLAKAEAPEAIGVRINNVGPFGHQQFGAAAAHFGHQGAAGGQRRVGEQKRLHAEERDANNFCFVERLDLKAGGDVNAIDEGQAVGRLAYGAGGDDADLGRVFDAVFLEDSPVALEHADT